VKWEQLVIITINGETYTHEFCVCDLATHADAIIGTDFLSRMNATLDFDRGKLYLKRAGRIDHDTLRGKRRVSRGTGARAALTVFSRADGRGRQESCWIGCKQREERQPKQTKMSITEIEIRSSDSWLVKKRHKTFVFPHVLRKW
jgi:hypothetical protein